MDIFLWAIFKFRLELELLLLTLISSECWFLSAHFEQTGNLKIMHALFLLFSCCCLVAKSCSALCKPMHCSLPGFSVRGIPRQEYWSGWPFPSWRYVPDPGIELVSPALARRFFTAEPMSPPLQKLSQPAQAWAADGRGEKCGLGIRQQCHHFPRIVNLGMLFSTCGSLFAH